MAVVAPSTSPLPGARIRALGHANVRASHGSSFELVPEATLTQRGTCIVGVCATWPGPLLREVRGPIEIHLRCGSVTDRVRARVNPLFVEGDPFIVRKHERPLHRTFAYAADKGAADLHRDLVAALRAPDAELTVEIEAASGTPGPGALFLVGLPIGDIADLGARARRVLASVDLIFAEDTRVAEPILTACGAVAKVVSCFDQNEERRAAMLGELLADGRRVALITDAGMPAISDPGYRLVQAAVAAEALVCPVPGASAVLCALAASGIASDRFSFLGFVPRKDKERRGFLDSLRERAETTVLFEAPHRLRDTLVEIDEVLGGRFVCVARELTKTHEHFVRGTARQVLEALEAEDAFRGEVTLVVAGAEPSAARDLGATSEGATLPPDVESIVRELRAEGVGVGTLARALARALKVPKPKVYDAIVRLRGQSPGSGALGDPDADET